MGMAPSRPTSHKILKTLGKKLHVVCFNETAFLQTMLSYVFFFDTIDLFLFHIELRSRRFFLGHFIQLWLSIIVIACVLWLHPYLSKRFRHQLDVGKTVFLSLLHAYGCKVQLYLAPKLIKPVTCSLQISIQHQTVQQKIYRRRDMIIYRGV